MFTFSTTRFTLLYRQAILFCTLWRQNNTIYVILSKLFLSTCSTLFSNINYSNCFILQYKQVCSHDSFWYGNKTIACKINFYRWTCLWLTCALMSNTQSIVFFTPANVNLLCNILIFENTNLKKNTYIGFIRIKSSTLCLLPGVWPKLINIHSWFVKTRLLSYFDADAEFCYHDGKNYLVGTSSKIDCNTCTCMENGLIGCIEMACLGMCNFQIVIFRPKL